MELDGSWFAKKDPSWLLGIKLCIWVTAEYIEGQFYDFLNQG